MIKTTGEVSGRIVTLSDANAFGKGDFLTFDKFQTLNITVVTANLGDGKYEVYNCRSEFLKKEDGMHKSKTTIDKGNISDLFSKPDKIIYRIGWTNLDKVEFQPDIPFSKEEAQVITQGEGIWKHIDKNYENKNSNISLEEFKKEIHDLFQHDEEFKKSVEFMNMISPYFGKTKEELEQIIPDGAYQVDNGALVLWTGKGGFINIILTVQEEINKYKLL